MATTDEKRRALIQLVGLKMANEILAQAQATEKQADDLKLKYKERQDAAAPFAGVPGYLPPAASGIGAVLRAGK